ncbi:hypothetical protein BDA96_07G122700 [Sorghum bicolor]|uniref:Uncharacterized protein n=1 Tax=Sorghum bicolor TaxID=4558 RepID=A0A921QN27_SORBI|nr:hypothetical protein BDA96_07G122700 [Sorghum bicolor]
MWLMNQSCRICHAYKEDTGADQLAWHLLARSRGGLLVLNVTLSMTRLPIFVQCHQS